MSLPSRVRQLPSVIRRLPSLIERFPGYVIYAEALAVGSLAEWLYSDYRNNQFQQGYLQQLQISDLIAIGVAIGASAFALSLLFWIFRKDKKRFLIAEIFGAFLIAILGSLFIIDYGNNAFLQAYVAGHAKQIEFSFLGVVAFYIGSSALTRLGVTKRMLIRIGRDDLLALLGYTALTLGFTYPVILHLTDAVPQVSRDIWHVLWDLSWVNQSVTSFHNPYVVDTILYPTGTNGVFHTWTFVNSIPAIPLEAAFGLVTTLNLLFLFSYILSGLNTFFLARYLTRDFTASFIAGMIYTFSPQHLIQSLAHLNIMTQQWLPLYALFLIKMIKEKQLRNGLYAGISLALVTYSDLHFLYMAFTMTLLLLLYVLWRGRDLILNRKFLDRTILLGGSFAVLLSPFIIAAFPLFSQGSFLQQGISSVTKNSADLTTFFVPSQTSALYGLLAQAFSLPTSSFSSISNRYQFVGYTVLLLAIYALFRSRKNRWKGLGPLWGVMAASGAVLALGPYLILSGKPTSIQLPYYFLYVNVFQDFPLTVLRSIRAVSRFSILVMMALSMLAAIAVKDINEQLRRRQSQTRVGQYFGTLQVPHVRVDRAKLFSILIIALVLFEYWSAPLPIRSTTIPSYYQIIAQDHNKMNVVLEVPVFLIGSSYLYYQTYHQHVLVNGKLARNPPYTVVFTETTPFIRTLQLRWPTKNEGPVVQTLNETQIAPYVLGQYNITYIVVHRTIPDVNASSGIPVPFPRAQQIISTLSSVIGPPIYNGPDAALFRFDDGGRLSLTKYLELNSNSSSLLMLQQGDWYGLGSISSQASLQIYSSSNTTVQLEITLQGQGIQRELQINDEGGPPIDYLVDPGKNVTLVTAPLPLREGPNTISLSSLQPCTIISATNPVCISFLFRSIQIATKGAPAG